MSLPTTSRTSFIVRCLGAAAALLGTACSGAPDDQESLEPATVTAHSEGATASEPAAAPVDHEHVRVLGTLEAVSANETPGTTAEPIAGAEVCLVVAGVTTCTTSDDQGVYAFEGLAKTTEPAEIVATREGFVTTVTVLSLEDSASHALGMVPESMAPSSDRGIVLVRSLVKAYSMTDLVPGVQIDVTVANQQFRAMTDAHGSTMFGDVMPGEVTAVGLANTLHCEVWAGNSSATLTAPLQATAGVVTQVDVLCNVDNNDKL